MPGARSPPAPAPSRPPVPRDRSPSERGYPALGRRDDDLLGDPPCDVGGVGRWQPQDDVLEAGGDGLTDRAPGGAGLVVGERQDDRAGDRRGVATDLGAETIQQRAATVASVEVSSREV